jgi:ABC-type branched-subunit amino acid transport system substrate-binding protein
MISPFDTGPFLTRRGTPGSEKALAQFYANRPRNFVRTIGADHILAAAAASFAQQLGLHRVAVLYDRNGMLQQMQERWFAYAARRLGLTAVPVYVDPQRRTLAATLSGAHADGAFLVSFILGQSPATGAPVLAALNRSLAGRPVIVTDVFPWPAAAGNAARFYALNAGVATPERMTPLDRALLAELPPADRIPWAVAQTAAATRALLAAIAGSDGTRRSVLARLRETPFLDPLGDPRTAPVTVLRIPTHGAPASFPFFPKSDYVTTITPAPAIVPKG